MAEFRLMRDPISGIYSQVQIPKEEAKEVYTNNNLQNVIPVVQSNKIVKPIVTPIKKAKP